jgi:hypothetical protein
VVETGVVSEKKRRHAPQLRFGSSQPVVATSDANFGIKGAPENIGIQCVSNLKFLYEVAAALTGASGSPHCFCASDAPSEERLI